MKKSGLADSPFFKIQAKTVNAPLPAQSTNKKEKISKLEAKSRNNRDTTVSRHHDTTTPRYQEAMIAIIRKAVKEFGKEAATHRFTLAEKKSIADIIYTYKNQGVKTTENEVSRIAVNYIIEDFKQNGENSILDSALKAIND